MWRIELVLSFGGVLGSCKPCSQLVFEVTNSVPSLLDVARWGQRVAGDSHAPASAGAPASGAGSVHQFGGKSLGRKMVSHVPQGYLVCSVLLLRLS